MRHQLWGFCLIKKIRLVNWKSFAHATLHIDPLTILIGPDASGNIYQLSTEGKIEQALHEQDTWLARSWSSMPAC